jgi:hypothetical protein
MKKNNTKEEDEGHMNSEEAFTRVLNTLKKNKIMVSKGKDGIYIRLADDDEKGAFSLEFGKVFSYDEKIRKRIHATDFFGLVKKLKSNLDAIHYEGDLSDIGNEIGFAIGEYLNEHKDAVGGTPGDFINGFKHGISLTNGTH